MGQRPQIQPRSRDNGPASADTAQIPGQWASVRRYSPDPETMGQRPQIRPRSRDNGDAVLSLRQRHGKSGSDVGNGINAGIPKRCTAPVSRSPASGAAARRFDVGLTRPIRGRRLQTRHACSPCASSHLRKVPCHHHWINASYPHQEPYAPTPARPRDPLGSRRLCFGAGNGQRGPTDCRAGRSQL